MKTLSTKTLYTAWAIACLFTFSLVLAFVVSRWFFIPFCFFIGYYIKMILKELQCPNCGKMESLLNLTYAMKHPSYCRRCGQQIIIKKED